MENIKIRRATLEDAAEIANVHINSWREVDEDGPPPPPWVLRSN